MVPQIYELTGNIEFLLYEAITGDRTLSKFPQSAFEQLIRNKIDGEKSSLDIINCNNRIEAIMLAITNNLQDFSCNPQSRIEELLYLIYNKNTVRNTGSNVLTDENGNSIMTENGDYIVAWDEITSYEAISRIESLLLEILIGKIWH